MWLRARVLKDAAARVACAAMVVCSACGGDSADATTGQGNGGAGTNGSSSGDTSNGAGTNGSGSGSGSGGQGGQGSSSTGDDGGANLPDLSDDDTFFRADLLKLIKPGLVTKPLGGGLGQPSITAQAQNAVDDSLVNDNEPDDGDGTPDDGDGDGYVDLNAIIRFLGKVDPSMEGGIVTAGAGLCPYPYDPSQVCGPLKLGPFQNPAQYVNGQDCALDGTDKVASGSCFSSEKGDFVVNIQLIGAVPLEDTQVIGSWVDDGKGGIANGWIRGFLTEEVAKKTKAPDQLPLAATLLGISGGTPLSDFLADADKQASPPGWWFLLQYSAKPAIYDSSVGPDGEK